ncbi:SGNH/GDSL hydrolase family protein [Inquilinus limosus]|uniref:SGNH/GDSL hydrolase family protein n=1 Tax=Inquilinus limosus TaxID=171674 RepID=UPI003F15DEA0
MAVPTVDEIWADYNPDGSVKEPAKQEIRRNLRALWAIAEANGMKTYPNKAVMDADVTQDNGQPALLYADPVEANNYPTVWVYNDSLNQWIAGADRIQSLKVTVDLLNNVARRIVVLGGEIISDRLNLLGGGTAQIYIPRNIFIDMPGVAATNLTISPDSTELLGWVKLAVPAGLRGFIYLDLTDNSYKVIGATSGDFTLPTAAVDKIVPLVAFPVGAGAWSSPFKIRELNPTTAISTFAAISPIVHSRADNKVLIPGATVRNESSIYSHTVAGGQRFEEFDLAQSNTSIITYWFDFRANAYKVTAGGGAPFTVDPLIGVVIGWSWGGEFFSTWPHIGRMGQAAGRNDFAWGRGDRLLQAPHVWNDRPSRLEMVDVIDSTLIAAGFTRAIRTKDQALAWPYVGDRIPDNRPGKTFFARIWLEATSDGYFGQPTVSFRKADGVTAQSVPFALEKTLSARAAIYSVAAMVPDWQANNPSAGEYTIVLVGTATPVGQPEVRVAGAQFAFGQGAQWIERNDFPTTPANAIRIANLEAAQQQTNPVPSILYGDDLWLIQGRKQSIHIDNLYEKRTERKGVLTTLLAPSPDINDLSAKPYELSLEAGSFVVDPAEIGNTAWLWAHRYSDSDSGNALGRSYRSAPITVHTAAATGGGAVRVMGIGDSIMSQTLSLYVQQILVGRGNAVTMTGTVGLNEGRPGSTFTDHIRARTNYLTPVTDWAAYLAADQATRQRADPWTRPATGSDPAPWVFNNRIFDFSYYLTNTGITPPTHVWICLGTNDLGSYNPAEAADWVGKGLDVMVNQILAAVPTVNIAIGLPTLPRMGQADTRWNDAYGLAIRKMLGFKRALANPAVKVLPIWAHINQVTGFANAEVVVATDPDTGMQTLDNGDMLHPSQAGAHQYAELVAAWVANTADGI